MINDKRRVLVTGATGFIGSYLIPALLDRGWEIFALVHKRDLPTHLKIGDVHVIHGGIDDAKLLQETISQVNAVCHLAAYIPPDYEDPAYARDCLLINSLGTLNIVEALLKYPKVRFTTTTTAGAYRYSDAPVLEDAPLYPSERATYYLASKIVGELYTEHLRLLHHLSAIILRISACYGYGMPNKSVVSRFMNCARQNQYLEVWDGGIPTYDFIYVSDVINIIALALERGEPGIYNVGSGSACSVVDLAKAIADTFPEREVPIHIKPHSYPITRGFPALCIDKMVKEWCYTPLSLREGLCAYRKQMERQ